MPRSKPIKRPTPPSLSTQQHQHNLRFDDTTWQLLTQRATSEKRVAEYITRLVYEDRAREEEREKVRQGIAAVFEPNGITHE